MSNTIQEAMAFKHAHPKFYKADHSELYALVEAVELFDEPDLSRGSLREVKLSPLSSEVDPDIIPHISVEVFTPEIVKPVTYLKVLGVKLEQDASKWLLARAVHPHRDEKTTTLVARSLLPRLR
jgi:hypothetical protein